MLSIRKRRNLLGKFLESDGAVLNDDNVCACRLIAAPPLSWFGTVVVPQVAPHACVGSSLFECLAAGHSVEFVPLTNQEQRWMLGLRLRTAVRLTKAPKTRTK